MKIVINCKKCKKLFEVTKYLISIRKGKFCSRSCYYKSKIGEKMNRRVSYSNVKCYICEKQFERVNRCIREFNFCSKKCVGKYNKILMSGKNNWNWKGGKTDKRTTNNEEYKNWRKSVFERDNYQCQGNNCDSKRGEYIHAHHIKPWSKYPELRLEVSNGLTLCIDCHLKKGLHRK